MYVEILGSGGSFTIPRPNCKCIVCKKARKNGIPFSRTGPSVFVHGPNILIDTPEESKDQLNRGTITSIGGCLYSHYHGDHVMGRRIWWSLNYDFKHVKPRHRLTPIYIPQQVAVDFREHLGTWQHLRELEDQKMVRLEIVEENASINVSGVKITPIPLADTSVYGFLFTEKNRRLLIIMDDMFNWQPTKETIGVDLAILPMGVAEFNPFNGKRRMGKNHPVLVDEATLDDTLKVAEQLCAKQVVLSHIEEHDGLGYDDLERLSQKFRENGRNIRFAYDTMTISV